MTPDSDNSSRYSSPTAVPTTVNKQALVDIAHGGILMFRGFAALTPSTKDDEWAAKIAAWEERLLPLVASDGVYGEFRDTEEAMLVDVVVSKQFHDELVAASQVVESHAMQGAVGGPLADFALKIALQELIDVILGYLEI